MNESVSSRLKKLHMKMEEEKADFLLITSQDCHMSEYVCSHYRTIQYFSGFSGSDADLLLTSSGDYLWTDGRYFVQAANELRGTGIQLMRSLEPGVPRISEHIEEHIEKGQTLCFDAQTVSLRRGLMFEDICRRRDAKIADSDLCDGLWEDRPPLPAGKVFTLDESLSGRSGKDKLSDLSGRLKEKGLDALLISALDEICWLLNIRGGDIQNSPLALSNLYVSLKKKPVLFIHEECLGEEEKGFIESSGVEIRPYDDFRPFLDRLKASDRKLLLDRNSSSYFTYSALKEKCDIVVGESPVQAMKAVKNETELKNLRRVYIEDSAVLTKALLDLKEELPHDGKTEAQVAGQVDINRSHLKTFIEPSFPTIVAFGANAAMMHYEPDKVHSAEITNNNILLIDSGGHYFGGTTDVTRTILIGDVSDEVKKLFTMTVCGMLNLADAVFIDGCTGRNLDILARGPLWRHLSDYKCGTGHGVGYILNVHEGPHSIRWRASEEMPEVRMEAGMIVSDEPGVYKEGRYGIRIENILEVVPAGESGDGRFLKFSHLTYVPIDLDLIDVKYMTDDDLSRLNAYHAEVCRKLLPFMDGRYAQLLMEATRTLYK